MMNLQNEASALDLIGYDCFSHSSLWFLPHTQKNVIQFTWRQSTNSIKSEPFSFSFISPLFIAIYTLSVMQIDVFLVFQMTSKSSTRRVMIYWLVCIENVWPKLLPINLTAMQKKLIYLIACNFIDISVHSFPWNIFAMLFFSTFSVHPKRSEAKQIHCSNQMWYKFQVLFWEMSCFFGVAVINNSPTPSIEFLWVTGPHIPTAFQKNA